MLRYAFLLLSIFSFTHCNNAKIEKDNPNSKSEGIAPHEDAIGAVGFDDEEQAILAEAKGRKMIESTGEQVLSLWEEASDQGQIFLFWSLEDVQILQQMETLHALENDIATNELEIFTIYIGEDTAGANTLLRTAGLAATALHLKTAFDFTKIDKNWRGKSPVLFINNKREGIQSSYEQILELEALKVILESLGMKNRQ